jgi:potassium-transporting ATPase KdpC subunit
MSILREVSRSIRVSFVLWVLVAVIYPFAMLLIGQVVFPYQANGSLIRNAQGQAIGSALIGQPYSTGDAPILVTGVSGASNLAPSNPDLIQRIQAEKTRLQQANIPPAADLLYTSGSSLDPHITIDSARAQIERVGQARNLDRNQLEILVNTHTQGRLLGIFGEPGVNVLELNTALDALTR